tara:strand:- start:43 stop:201 length:159 start_codon:yes stop_codon:yes gene_type:complete
MRTSLLLVPALLLAFAAPLLAGDFPWETDLAAAEKRALSEGKPLLIVFRCLP